jgi:hypothetical protein
MAALVAAIHAMTLGKCENMSRTGCLSSKLARCPGVDGRDHERELAKMLRPLVCAPETNTVDILRGLAKNRRLAATSREAPALIAFLEGSNCRFFTRPAGQNARQIQPPSLTPRPPAALTKPRRSCLLAAIEPAPARDYARETQVNEYS